MPLRTLNRHCAFTLIELLVVIAIIALLVSILLPSLNRAKELAKRAICGSNMRNTAMAVLAYTAESGGVLPFGQAYHWTSGGGFPSVSWDDLIHPFVAGDDLTHNEVWATFKPQGKASPMLQCPSDSYTVNRTYVMNETRSWIKELIPPGAKDGPGAAGIGSVSLDVGAGGGGPWPPPIYIHTLQATSDTIALTETAGKRSTAGVYQWPEGHQQGCAWGSTIIKPYQMLPEAVAGGWWSTTQNDLPLHDKDCMNNNYAYADGHVEYKNWWDTRTGDSKINEEDGQWTRASGD
jgi:prepilin-type N-terminal cleavage/methylation domain-containing protein/prepilin-type processing-associated H-X9-DG protein